MKFKFVFLISLSLILIFGPICIYAQSVNMGFRHITYKEGLLQSPINSLIQDRDGYIWIGNLSGLSRYDGSSFTNFRQNDADNTQISHNRINKIFEDRAGRMWVATGGGLNLYDKKTESFRHIGLSTAKGGTNFITDIQQDQQGQIWIATFKGIKKVGTSGNTLQSINRWKKEGENELYQGIAFSLFADKDHTIWAGIKQGLKRFDPVTGNLLPLPEPLLENRELAVAKITVIKQDNNGDLWFGTEEDGVFRYSIRNNNCVRYIARDNDSRCIASNWINDILIHAGKIWVATRNGLSIYDEQKNVFTTYHHDSADFTSLNDDSVWSLMEDKTGNVWVGTYSGGINIYYPGNTNFKNIGERIGNSTGLNKPQAEALIEDKDQGLWVGSFAGGLNFIDRKKNIVRYYPLKDARNHKYTYEIKALAKDISGNIWAGTLDGLYKFNTHNKSIQYIKLETTNSKTGGKLINSLLTDQNGIWIGTNGNGLRFVNYQGIETRKFISEPDVKNGLSDNYVNAILNDGNVLWVGTQNGLNKLDKTTGIFSLYKRTRHTGLGNNNVLSLFKDSFHRLWIGTDGGGLNYLNEKTNQISIIKQADGLADNVIASIVEDNSGALWVSTNNGLSHVSFKNNALAPGKENLTIKNYNSDNGLLSNQFLVNSRVKTSSGEILFGGMNGITTFYPDKIINNRFKPAILFTGFAINNKEVRFGKQAELQNPINETHKIQLPYDRNNITIKFSALNFINPEKNSYAYKMSGLRNNDNWQIIGTQNEVSFTNLAPGNYLFSVRASNNDGMWNNEGRQIQLVIAPPLWQTWWAYLIYLLLAATVFYKIIQFFQIRARLERDLYNEHLQNERQQEFYQMKLDFFTNISHEIRTPLTLILGPIENLYHHTMDNAGINRQVLQIKNNAERLLRLISELMDFRKSETGHMVLYIQRNNMISLIKEIYLSFSSLAESRGIVYEFQSEMQEVMMCTDRDQMEKVFFNLLSNAFKFTPDQGKIQVRAMTDQTDFITISVTDNGKGIPEAFQEKLFSNFYQVQPDKANPGTGIGLALSKSIVELHKGNINVVSRPQIETQEGLTVFTVKLPYEFSPSEHVHFIEDNLSAENLTAFRLQSDIDVLTEQVPEVNGRKYTILLCEDNDELRHFIADSLPQYQVIPFENGATAFAYAVEEIPDLIISDVMMPVMNGLELCNRIKTDDRTSHIPVILLTALAAHIHQINGLETGADAYLTKPFSIKLLSLNIHNLLAARELMRKKFSQQMSLPAQQLNNSNPDRKFIQKLMQLIDTHMEDPEFGVLELSSEIGMSKSVLYKKVCALTDQSPADFMKTIRLKKAAELLVQQGLTVNEVASLVGFNDRKYFSREFKKQHGRSPSEMIGQHK
jgi:signal transduction histidine kinase/ligand-binding sensor domain-containing protein/DNA-binding response OmpR family regulator